MKQGAANVSEIGRRFGDGNFFYLETVGDSSGWESGRFGVSLDLRGWETLVVGRGGRAEDEAVLIYHERSYRWTSFQTLRSPEPGDGFGSALALSEGNSMGRPIVATPATLVVGAPRNDSAGEDAGAVFIYAALEETTGTSVPGGARLPLGLRVDGPYPNPTSGTARLQLTLAASGQALVQLYDVHGRIVERREGWYPAGRQELVLDVSRLAAGAYVWRVAAGAAHYAGVLTVTR